MGARWQYSTEELREAINAANDPGTYAAMRAYVRFDERVFGNCMNSEQFARAYREQIAKIQEAS
jgi:hypothetical protein